jgi:hypothetical protein
MPLRVKCTGCGQVLEAPDHLAGERAKCQSCGTVIELPLQSSFVQPKEVAGESRQAVSPPSSQTAAPQTSLPQERVTIAPSAAPTPVDHAYKTASASRTGLKVALGCLAAGALFFLGGGILIAMLAAGRAMNNADSMAEESGPSAAELVLGTQIPSDQGFEFKNVTTRRDFSILKVLGKVTNKSGRSYSVANFTLTLYDRSGKVLDTEYSSVSHLPNGATKSFEIPVVGAWGDEIGRYKIEFRNGM